ncbi:hypothetical protein J3R82DRAFT_11279 [Butyriboletus roseoflavus]|nr:hypothetical protein J3R82DRAFT_11279 [Butyriboletus roseoflavus]
MSDSYEWPSRFLDLKRELVSATTQECLTASWNDILSELAKRTAEIAQAGTNFVPQVKFTDLEKLTPEEIDVIKRKGSVVIRGVVDTNIASGWKTELEEFIKANPHAEGIPENDKQFFHLYWTRPQVQARAHPNVLKASAWLSSLYHVKSGKKLDGVDLSVPLTYADRFRIRHPGVDWSNFPPHVDGGAIERWEDDTFRRCFEDILTGDWRQHDPYELEHRLDARSSLYGRPGQASVFRTFQGWLAMSETAPTEGTLRVFPDLRLSNAYTILRPFFRPTVRTDSPDILDPKNWKFDISTADFPGIIRVGPGYSGPQPTPQLHPHLRLEETMTSVPKVNPGDMVFWHCVSIPSGISYVLEHIPNVFQDVVHSVEQEHTGSTDSAVMYIGAVPKTPLNSAYVVKQAQTFLAGQNPPDFAKLKQGATFVGLGGDVDVKEPISRVAMGLSVQVA